MATRQCHYCYTKKNFQLVEEVPEELLLKAHELNVPLRTQDRRGLLDVEHALSTYQTVVFDAHDGPCGLPCLGSYRHPVTKFEDHPGQLCREIGCRSKMNPKQLNAIVGYHDGSSCPCNTPPPADEQV